MDSTEFRIKTPTKRFPESVILDRRITPMNFPQGINGARIHWHIDSRREIGFLTSGIDFPAIFLHSRCKRFYIYYILRVSRTFSNRPSRLEVFEFTAPRRAIAQWSCPHRARIFQSDVRRWRETDRCRSNLEIINCNFIQFRATSRRVRSANTNHG